jgi:hypothetical protein
LSVHFHPDHGARGQGEDKRREKKGNGAFHGTKEIGVDGGAG